MRGRSNRVASRCRKTAGNRIVIGVFRSLRRDIVFIRRSGQRLGVTSQFEGGVVGVAVLVPRFTPAARWSFGHAGVHLIELFDTKVVRQCACRAVEADIPFIHDENGVVSTEARHILRRVDDDSFGVLPGNALKEGDQLAL